MQCLAVRDVIAAQSLVPVRLAKTAHQAPADDVHRGAFEPAVARLGNHENDLRSVGLLEASRQRVGHGG